MFYINKEDYQKILNHAVMELPNEACGLLGGYEEAGKRIVTEVYLLKNIENSREHFSMEPKEQFTAVKDMRSKGWQLLGSFHSHPETSAAPSKEDIRLAYDENLSYLILSLIEVIPILKAFRIKNGVAQEEKIEISEET